MPFFHNSHKNSFHCLGFLNKNIETSLGEGACSGKSRAARSENNKKLHTSRPYTDEKSERAKKTSSLSMCCCCDRRCTFVRHCTTTARETRGKKLCFVDDFARIHETSSSFSFLLLALLVLLVLALSWLGENQQKQHKKNFCKEKKKIKNLKENMRKSLK